MNLSLSPHSSLPLYRQIYEQIKHQILSGQLPEGYRFPPNRQLAKDYQIARMTIQQAMDQLREEGYITTRPGAGTFVAVDPPPGGSPQKPPRLTSWARRIRALQLTAPIEAGLTPRPHSRPGIDIDFGFGRSFAGHFPYDIWRRLLGRYLSTDDAMLSRYGSPAGFGPLRQAIAHHVADLKGVRCQPEDIVIVNGFQQAIDILGRLLISPGDQILVETPGYANAYKVFRAYGAELIPLPVDYNGFPTEKIPADCRAQLVFVTPANQFPHGGAMSLARRLALLAWAQKQQALIIEDDYDGELRFSGRPLGSLQGIDARGEVIYLGTFSRVLFPALRLGYVVLPRPLQQPFLQAKQLMDRGAPTLTQAAVADFIAEGYFNRHLTRLRQIYGSRHHALLDALATYLPHHVTYSQAPAGLQLLLYLPPQLNERDLIRQAAAIGVGVYSGAPYHVPPQQAPPSILLGFAGLDEDQIWEGIRRLATIWPQ